MHAPRAGATRTWRLRASLVLGSLAIQACSAGTAATPEPEGQGGNLAGGGAPPSGNVGNVPGAGGVPLLDPGNGPLRESCATAAFQGQLLPTNLLFIVDRSGSMNCNLGIESAACEQTPVTDDPAQPTRWSALDGSMSSALDQLAGVPNTSVGLSFFSNDDTCGVSSAPNVPLALLSQAQVAALKGAMSGTTPRGGTPIIGATILGFKHLHEQAQAPGNRFVVLVTDGADSCIGKYSVQGDVVSQLLDVELPKALSVNIRTFVIGAPGSEAARGLLSRIAFAGGTAPADCDHTSEDPAEGTACHFDMTRSSDFAQDLSSALGRITGTAALTCEFEVPKSETGAALDTTALNVDYYRAGNLESPDAKVELYRDDRFPCDAGADGWQYIEGGTKIRICGATCDTVKADGNGKVVVSVGCEARVR